MGEGKEGIRFGFLASGLSSCVEGGAVPESGLGGCWGGPEGSGAQ